MSGPALVPNGNQLQGLSAAQLKQLNAIASMAKGSGLFEGTNGGKGFIGSFVDSTTGQKHYVKMLTHSDERTDALGDNAKEAKLFTGCERLGEMSDSMEDDLLKLAGAVGVEDEVQNLFNSRKGDFKDLVSRKIATQAVKLIGNAHNDKFGANGVRFDWDAVARAGKSGDTTLGNMLLMKERKLLEGIKSEIKSCEKKIEDANNAKERISSQIKNNDHHGADAKNLSELDAFIDNFTRKRISLMENLSKLERGIKRVESGLSDVDALAREIEEAKHPKVQSQPKLALSQLDDLANELDADVKYRSLPQGLVEILENRVNAIKLEIAGYQKEIGEKRAALEDRKKDIENGENGGFVNGAALKLDRDNLEKEIAGLNSLIIRRDTVLSGVKKDLAEAQKSLAEFNKLPEDDQLVGKAKAVVEAFAGSVKPGLNVADKGMATSLIGVLAGCNGTTEVRNTLQQFKDDVIALANSPEVMAAGICNPAVTQIDDLAKELKVDAEYRKAPQELVKSLEIRIKAIEREIAGYENAIEEKRAALAGRKKTAAENVGDEKNMALKQQNELEKGIADLSNLIIRRDAVLREAKKELAAAQARLAEFDKLPADSQLVVKAREAIEAFVENKLQLSVPDKEMFIVIARVLTGCNGTTEVLQCLRDNSEMFNNPKAI